MTSMFPTPAPIASNAIEANSRLPPCSGEKSLSGHSARRLGALGRLQAHWTGVPKSEPLEQADVQDGELTRGLRSEVFEVY